MAMSAGTAGGVKASPNVTPMIDVMLVLLIIFMVVTPALLAGFNAQPPQMRRELGRGPDRVVRHGARLVVLTEMFSTGFSIKASSSTHGSGSRSSAST